MMTLGPSVVTVLAQQTAVASFLLGATLGGLWYFVFPAWVPTNLLASTFVLLMLLSSPLAAAFAGVVVGLSSAAWVCLQRLLAVLEAKLRGPTRESLAVREHDVSCLLDLLDYAAAASRMLRSR
ncbi:putative outer membrane lipoprotein [Azospirillum canadense]|nr:putative outer membrane lipoprotein [Azospirillum canadense]